ncbi:hypothetical protein LOD99_13907 [Oopsacas minuta]|uniref:Uncharacterized protein n=1 Tax=Oopsacas minuta TaxID=111878 RepID=A0AAV7KGQ7_9METZ|nr:hypothetical protein LOD99_13907 [Oopsacas minuta]
MSYQYSYRGFSRHLHSGRCCPLKFEAQTDRPEVIWKNRRYNPNDLRVDTPVVSSPPKTVPPGIDKVLETWVKSRAPSVRDVCRGEKETNSFLSQPATRDENWSSLREMTPSRGRPFRHRPPSWGVSADVPPEMVPENYERYPRVLSAMTRHRVDQQYSYHNMQHIGLRPVKLALSGVRGGPF